MRDQVVVVQAGERGAVGFFTLQSRGPLMWVIRQLGQGLVRTHGAPGRTHGSGVHPQRRLLLQRCVNVDE